MKKIFLLPISALLVAIGSPVHSSDINPKELKEVTESFERVAKRLTGCKNLGTFQTKTNPLYSDDAPRVALKDLTFEEIEYGGEPRDIIKGIKVGDKAVQFGRIHNLCLDNGHAWTATKKGALFSFSGDSRVVFVPGTFLGMGKSPFVIEQDELDATYSKNDDQIICDTLHLADLYQLHLTGNSVARTVGDMSTLWEKYRVSLPMFAQTEGLYKSLTCFGERLGFESKGNNNRANGALATLKKIASVEQDRRDLISALLLSSAPVVSLAPMNEATEKADFFDDLWLSLLDNKVEDEIFASSHNEGSQSGFVYELVQRNTEHYSIVKEVLNVLLPDNTTNFAFTFFTERLGENSTFYQDKGKAFDFNKLFAVEDAPFAQYVELDK